jgi:hypothetical protein
MAFFDFLPFLGKAGGAAAGGFFGGPGGAATGGELGQQLGQSFVSGMQTPALPTPMAAHGPMPQIRLPQINLAQAKPLPTVTPGAPVGMQANNNPSMSQLIQLLMASRGGRAG